MKVKHLEILLYPDAGYSLQGILSVISKYKSIKKYCIILHDQDEYDADEFDKEGNLIAKAGALKKAHFHVYLNFGKVSIELDSAAKWFETNSNAVERVKGTMIDVIRYYTHEKYPDKHQYSYSDITANFDVEAFVAQEDAKCSVDELLERCASGEITQINHHFFIPPLIYIKHCDKFERAFKYNDDKQLRDANGEHAIRTAWLAGDTGTGKSTFVKLFAHYLDLPFYFTAAGNDPFSKYANEKIIALDDIRPGDPFSYSALLKLLDPEFISPVHARYKDVIPMCDYIFITSPYLPHVFAKNDITRKAEDSADQLFRRLDEVIFFTEDEIQHCILDKFSNEYKPHAHATNPAKLYYSKQDKKKPKPVLEIMSEKMLLDMEPKNSQEGFELDDEISF